MREGKYNGGYCTILGSGEEGIGEEDHNRLTYNSSVG